MHIYLWQLNMLKVIGNNIFYYAIYLLTTYQKGLFV